MTPDGLARSGSIKSQAMNPSSALLQPPQPLPPPAIPLTGSMAGSFSFPIEHSTSFQRVASWLRGGGRRLPYDNDDEEDDLRDFEASEWTPPDSSYGAAIPVAGWIPKNIRRTIEWTLMGGLLAIVCFWIVRTSVRADTNNLSNSSNSNRNSNHTTATNTSNSSSSYVNQYSKVSSYASYSGDLDLDDNRYISYKYMDNSYYQSDDDSQENAADDAFDYSSNQATTDDEMGGYAL